VEDDEELGMESSLVQHGKGENGVVFSVQKAHQWQK